MVQVAWCCYCLVQCYSLLAQDSVSVVDHVGILIDGVSDGDGEGECASGFDSLGGMEKGAYILPGLFENGEKSVDVHESLCVGRNVGDLYFACGQDYDFFWKRLKEKVRQ